MTQCSGHSSILSFCSLGFVYAGLAGLMGALASVGGKLTLSASEAVQQACEVMVHSSQLLEHIQCDTLTVTIRILSGAALILTNILMWLFFTKSLQLCSSSVEATITNTAVNFFASGVFGWLLFQENLPSLWWFGASLILIGLFFLNKGAQSAGITETDKHKAD